MMPLCTGRPPFQREPAKYLAVHVLLPIGLGALIYLLFRGSHLLVFQWVTAIGLDPLLDPLRRACEASRPHDLIVFSVPDALWVYATTSLMVVAWRSSSNLLRVPWIHAGWALALAAELGQAVAIVPGTYDAMDLGCCLVAFIVPLYLVGVRRYGP